MEELSYSSGVTTLREPYVYRGEGNAHLALALPTTRKILRIKKLDSFEEWTNDSEEDWKRDVRFYKEIMVPLFAPFADEVHPVNITPDEIARLQNNLQNIRPAFRRHKNLRCDNAALFTDYAYLPPKLDALGTGHTFSIEIKPKLGFPINGTCLFCEKQRKRFLAGKLETTSKYCPLLLFSSNESKMHGAIQGLVETPQNNFQLFKDGVLCYGQDFPMDYFNDTVREILCSGDENTYSLLSNFCKTIYGILSKKFVTNRRCSNCAMPERLTILESIYSIQAFDKLKKIYSIDFGGFNYANKYLEDVSDDNNKCPRCVMLGYIEERAERVCRGKNKYESTDDFINRSDLEEWEKEEEEGVLLTNDCGLMKEQDFNVSVPHYVSKIARDCSFMITMKRADDLNDDELVHFDENILETDHGRFVFSIKVFDLYPKLQKKLEMYT